MLKGNLSSFSLGEIFQSLAINNHTGTLRISTKDGGQRCIYFSRGEISLYSTGSSESLRFGEILLRQKKLTSEHLAAALEEQKQTSELLGKILVRKGLIDKEDVRIALETKIRDEIYDLFLLNEAEFEFQINHLPEEVFDPVQKNTRIAINTSMVILEGLRRVDEWRLIQRRIKTFDEIFARVAALDEPTGDEAGAQLWERIDGGTPVAGLFRYYPGSRFECCKLLYELTEAGHIRPLTVEEASASGKQALEAGETPRALAFFRFAEQTDPAHVEVLCYLVKCLRAVDKEEDANRVLQRAISLYHQRKSHREVVELAQPLLESPGKLEIELLDIVFTSSLALRKADMVRAAGNRLLQAAQEVQDFGKAAEVLERFCELEPENLNQHIELAQCYARAGEKARAVSRLEEVAETLGGKSRYKDLIKILVLILELDPRRGDVKGRVQKLLSLQEREEKRKKQRVTMLGAGVIVFLLVLTLPIFYELKARELYSHAQRLEQISLVSNDFSKVKRAYEEVLHSYGLSTRARRARLDLQRVVAFEKMRYQALEGEKAAAEKIQEEKLEAIRKAVPELLEEAKRLEAASDIKGAYEVYKRISTEFAAVPGSQEIPFPLLVTSVPKGATVEVDGTARGKTPILLRAQRGRVLNLTITRSGCEPAQEKIKSGEAWQAHFDLKRRPVGSMKVTGPIQQPIENLGDRLYFPSRDGFLYAVSISRRDVAWQRRVGRYGDLISDICVSGQDVLVGNVGGELAAVAGDTGKARWRARLAGAILAPPALSPDNRWVAAATVEGEVAILDRVTGEIKGKFLAGDEVIGGPAFIENILLVGSADHRLYELEVPTASPRLAVELPAALTTAITRCADGVVFGTAGGSLHRYSISQRRVLWSRALGAELTGPPVADAERIYCGNAAGDLVAVDAATGEPAWKLKISPGRVGRLCLARGRIYTGAESGDLVAVATTNGVKTWACKADSAITSPPLLAGDRLYVACTTGKIVLMELDE